MGKRSVLEVHQFWDNVLPAFCLLQFLFFVRKGYKFTSFLTQESIPFSKISFKKTYISHEIIIQYFIYLRIKILGHLLSFLYANHSLLVNCTWYFAKLVSPLPPMILRFIVLVNYRHTVVTFFIMKALTSKLSVSRLLVFVTSYYENFFVYNRVTFAK